MEEAIGNETERLLNCPFCGGEDIRERFENSESYIECLQCGATMPGYNGVDSRVAWNRRAAGWVPVEERLPRESEIVLMFDGDQVLGGRHYHGHWYHQGMNYPAFTPATHWTPLPEPPEAGEE
jgi:Lar family restriction alleviation protein